MGATIAGGLHRPIISASSSHIMLRIKTLGGWDVISHEGVARALPAQRVALLALLLIARDRGVSRDRVAALLWPESPEDNARHSLGQSVYALRRDAGSAEVVMGTTTLRLNPAVVSCDAWELGEAFDAGDMARVATSYAGPFLDGIHLRGSAELQQMVDRERERLAKLYASALDSLARAAAARGSSREAAEWWRRLAAVEPLSSRVALELVRSLAAAGDRTAALGAARVHEALVRSELEADPDPAFTSFADALRQEVVPAPAPAPVRMKEPAAAAPVPNVEPTGPGPSPSPAPRRRFARLTRFTRVGVASTSMVALMLGGQRFFRTAAVLDTTRVYVAPLENRTGDATLDPVGEMASDWISQGLERTGLVVVASAARAEGPATLRAMPEHGVSVAAQAARLGAGTTVSGAFYKAGDRLRFQVQISDVQRGEVLDAFDAEGGTASDPSAMLNDVRQRTMGGLASLVDPRLRSWVRVASKPPSYDAYREFVTGQRIWGNDHREALRHFLRAADIDSTYYAARVEAAILYRLLGQCARTESIARDLRGGPERLAPYEDHVLDEQVAQCNGDWQRSYREARAVSELRPRSAFLEYSLALQAIRLGRFDEAFELLDRHALEQGVAEVGPNYGVVLAQVLAARGDPVRGIDVARWLRSRYPGYAGAWTMEVALLARAGRTRDAERLIDAMGSQPVAPSSAVVTGLRRAAATFGLNGETAAKQRTLTRALAVLDADRGAGHQDRLAERGQILYEAGRLSEAAMTLTTALAADSTDVDVRGTLALIAARRRDTTTVAAADRWLATATTPYVFTHTLYRARLAALLGDRDRALGLLGVGLDEAGRFLLPSIREYAEFACIRRDPRFTRLTAIE